jgi:hypothetical protein
MDLSKLSDEDLAAIASGNMSGVSDRGLLFLSGKPQEKSFGQKAAQVGGNLLSGAVRGAGSIGATILTPVDAAARAMGIQNDFIGRTDRREAMTEGLGSMGADPESLAFQGAKIAAEIAGTAGIPARLAQVAAARGVSPSMVQALRTAGISGGNAAQRVGAGAVTGGAAAGMANPDEVTTGAAISAAIPGAVQVAKGVGSVAKNVLGGTTGVGAEAINQAYKAGKQGGTAARQFTSNLRGDAPMDEVLSMAKQNLQAIGQQRQQAYRSGMIDIKKDKSILDFGGIDDAIKNAQEIGTFKGQSTNDATVKAVEDAAVEVKKWKRLDEASYHTPEGLDALKKKVNSILERLDPVKERQARKAVGGIHDAIKMEIGKQAPEYAGVMRDYSDASDLIREIEGTLSLGQKARADTAMRKLQSLMRNNVNTSYGYRDDLAQQLQAAGGQDIMPALAGQAMSDWMPRGIQRATAGGGGAGLAFTGNIPAAAGLAAVSSPRLVGEAAYLAGQGAGRAIPALGRGILQVSGKVHPELESALRQIPGMVNPALVKALRQGGVMAAPIAGTQQGQ